MPDRHPDAPSPPPPPADSAALPCPVCAAPMIRVTSHDQCPRCGFILPCCDGDAICPPPPQEADEPA